MYMRCLPAIALRSGMHAGLAIAVIACARAPEPPAAAPVRAQAAAALAGTTHPRGGPLPALAVATAQTVASGATPFAAGCDGVAASGTLYIGAEVEPSFAIDPLDPTIMVGLWQQDRWSNGGSRGLVAGSSRDGGKSWQRSFPPFSRCGGGSIVNGGNYERASDAWLSYAPNGVLHAMSLSISGSVSAMLVSRSFDHGRTWTNAVPLIVDGAGIFNDKNAITADPADANFVYAVWDRLNNSNSTGPTYFSRSTDGGASWEAARPIYNPGINQQTIGNQIVVLPSGVLLDVADWIDASQNAHVVVLRSLDRGVSWTGPIVAADLLSTGTRSPDNGATVRDGSIIPEAAVAPNGDVYVVWQDARFGTAGVDSIAISRSSDGGLTWTAPARVNPDPNIAAFTPSVHVNRDGVVGVMYADFRSNTASAALSTDVWLARSSNGGANWSELRVNEPYDLSIAPVANGLFVGDYQGLLSANGRFMPFYVRANAGDSSNRTDVVAAPLAMAGAPPLPKTAAALRAELQARRAVRTPRMDALRARSRENVRSRMEYPPGFATGWLVPESVRRLQR